MTIVRGNVLFALLLLGFSGAAGCYRKPVTKPPKPENVPHMPEERRPVAPEEQVHQPQPKPDIPDTGVMAD